jgi:hypothetical protein
MPPTSHAARLRQMAEYQLSLTQSYKKTAPRVSARYGRNAAALLAGAEALECLKDIMESLPDKRDWLDPVTEARAKEAMVNG